MPNGTAQMTPAEFLALCRRHEKLFWARLGPRSPDVCWLWSGANDGRFGYGHLKLEGVTVKAHRASYALTKGEIAEGQFILHACDTPACCNPAHLSAGSHAANMADMVRRDRAKGGSPAGEGNHNARLTASNVIDIRARLAHGAKARQIAREYGVSDSMISRIKVGKAWT